MIQQLISDSHSHIEQVNIQNIRKQQQWFKTWMKKSILIISDKINKKLD
jgi:hypothetical protein